MPTPSNHEHPGFPAVDPDIDIHEPAQRAELSGTHGAVLTVIAVGGALGALARYALITLFPTPPGGFPWAVFGINVLGGFALGVLMTILTEIRPAHPLVRPFLGTGVIGGFTTFSTYAGDVHTLLRPGSAPTALVYIFATLFAVLCAVAAAAQLVRRVHAAIRVEVRA
ncbi:fluoride efflux transporter CrcB [Nocardia sp. NPDC058058]|uniref:fluoride efflux transporter CrcB n=1 Tax=Nocardia sp. NPDC058058 TaxID=3346317 RepID=UPI0036D8079C